MSAMDLRAAATAWGDEADTFLGRGALPAPVETEPDEQGIKTITSYRRNDKGQVEKVVRRVKIVTQYRRVQQAVLERRERMAKFGAAASTVNTENVTYPSYEEIKIEKPGAEAPDQLQKLAASASSAVVCRRCGGAHWTLSCPLKDVRGIGEGGPSASSAADAAASGGLQAGGSGKYVNPRARAAATGGASAGAGPEISEEELTQLRVLNLMDDVEDDSLRNLFAAYGHIEKLFIARDKVTGRSRGFAFVRYTRHDQALRAKEALDGYPYEHMILRVEWSWPDRNRGDAPLTYTGYGKKLAQDVVRTK